MLLRHTNVISGLILVWDVIRLRLSWRVTLHVPSLGKAKNKGSRNLATGFSGIFSRGET
jgi:hypothetical protein